jgi:Cdc6-like AAA superfamily ATPase
MDVGRLYRELDPLRPLAADEDALYVDWHGDFDPGGASVRVRLVRTFVRGASPERPIARLLTGHKGSGKTTELNRVASALQSGAGGKKVFVSTLFAQPWLDIEDVQAEDVVLQIVRQLVADLHDQGMDFAAHQLRSFLQDLWEELGLHNLPNPDPLQFSFALKDFPAERQEFRELLRRQLPAMYDLVNKKILPEARRQLAQQGYQDVLLIIDDLDKIPQKVLRGDLTNHENLFLDQSSTLSLDPQMNHVGERRVNEESAS